MKYIVWGVILYFVYKQFFAKKKKLTPEELAAQEAERIKRLEEKKRQDEQRKAAQIEHERIRTEAEQKLLNELLNSSHRLYFSTSLVNENSSLYLINPQNNEPLVSSKTTLQQLYAQGWRLHDIDKTGKSAQFDGFNFVVRLSR
jgi:hypothetical protein